MTSAETIKQEIEARVNSDGEMGYSLWFIGVTADPVKCREELGNIKTFFFWMADDAKAARAIKTDHIRMGFNEAPGNEGQDGQYVYIF
jgi:hypothetical protein